MPFHRKIQRGCNQRKIQFEYLGENTEKYITISEPLEKQENGKAIKYKTTLIYNPRFIIQDLWPALCHVFVKDCKSSLEYMTANDDLLTFKCADYKKTYEKKFNEDLLKRFPNTYKLCGGDINIFCLMLRKGVCLNEYMDGWERFNET